MPRIFIEITIIFLAGYLAANVSLGASAGASRHADLKEKVVKEQHVI